MLFIFDINSFGFEMYNEKSNFKFIFEKFDIKLSYVNKL